MPPLRPRAAVSSPPVPPVDFAFLVHPRTDVAADVGRVFRPLGLLPSSTYEGLFGRVRVPTIRLARAALATEPARTIGRVLFVPLTPRQLLTRPELALDRITAAVDTAVADGAGIVGLGALTAPATAGGELLRDRTDVGVTNGNAFTAAITAESVLRACAHAPRPGVALVGATGSVGSAVARLLARAGVPELLLVGRTPATLETLAEELRGLGAGAVRTSLAVADVRGSGVVVLLTSATGALLGSEHLGPDTLVIDDTQPRNTSPRLALERPDVLVLDGGIVETPGIVRTGGSINLPATRSYACLAETILLGLAGHGGHGTLGRPSLDDVDRLVALSGRFAHLGFALAPPTSFGAPVARELWRSDEPAFASLAASLPELARTDDAAPVVLRPRPVPLAGRSRHVVLLGGGYASTWAYRALSRRRRLLPGLRMTVVAPHDVHAFHGFTGEVLSGELPAAAAHSPLGEVFRRASILRGTATAVDPAARTVTVETPDGAVVLHYDQLVVGTGSREATAAVDGLAEFGRRLRAPDESAALLAHLETEADPGPVVVVGGGLSGAEAACALATRFSPERDVVLLSPSEPGTELRSLAPRVRDELARAGVRVVAARARRVEPGRVELSDGTTMLAAVVVATPGNRPSPLPGLPVTDGQLTPSATLAVADGVWTAGDAARVPRRNGDLAPQDALWAIRAGTHAGRNVARTLRGRRPRRFGYLGLGLAAGFGRGRALVRIYGVPLTGAAAWTARMGFFLWFVPSRRQALRLAVAYARPRRSTATAAPAEAAVEVVA